MITNRDLAVLPTPAARPATAPDPALSEAWDRFAARLTDRSLDRVQRVILRLHSTASLADPDMHRALLGEVDELDAALRAAREVIFPPTGPHDHAPPAATNARVTALDDHTLDDHTAARRPQAAPALLASAQQARAAARHERNRHLEIRRQRLRLKR